MTLAITATTGNNSLQMRINWWFTVGYHSICSFSLGKPLLLSSRGNLEVMSGHQIVRNFQKTGPPPEQREWTPPEDPSAQWSAPDYGKPMAYSSL